MKDDLSNTLPKKAIEDLEKNDTTATAISDMEIVKAVGVIWFVYVFTGHKYTDRCLNGQMVVNEVDQLEISIHDNYMLSIRIQKKN
ncbi:hypothetical protein [Pedobacter ginsengisoli]|uniref:hypothetical protein n=1 Tax=Pedobacter ginsengisoli TaxID=363852 RepID=UPI00254D2CE3|nr:hypothetical protein [Pedobacter ginsengisoli]